MITVNITPPRQLAGITAVATSVGQEPQEYFQRVVEGAAESYRDQFFADRVTASEFILRFTDEEKAAITRSTDEIVIGFMDRVKSEPYVWLASDEVVNSIEYLVSQNLITQERSTIILQY